MLTYTEQVFNTEKFYNFFNTGIFCSRHILELEIAIQCSNCILPASSDQSDGLLPGLEGRFVGSSQNQR